MNAALVAACGLVLSTSSASAADCELYVQDGLVCASTLSRTHCAHFTPNGDYRDTPPYRCLLPALPPSTGCDNLSIAPNLWLSLKAFREGKTFDIHRTAAAYIGLARPYDFYDAAKIISSCRPTCYPASACNNDKRP
ncbi:hypothetical protein [Rhodoplanes sp. SY1]|uniref:hypothetical protein n=1 Tax=Rhodoplanes sp. SY1 TaxID=3166646 RepID=UPI0038B69609